MHRALLLMVFLLSCAGVQAGEVGMRATASLVASVEVLTGELSLQLEGQETIYDIQVSAIRDGRVTPLHSAAVMHPGATLPLTLDLPYRHTYPGRYHLYYNPTLSKHL